jgi:metallo-beta-lactamase family protein
VARAPGSAAGARRQHQPGRALILSFHGAARGVTGSCQRLEAAGLVILVDCGLFQGKGDLARENLRPLGFDPASVDYLLLTHAHLDHCGRIPLLVKQGFRGEIIATAATRELARLVLQDAARLQEEDANAASRRPGPASCRIPAPLYTRDDAEASLLRFGRDARYGEPIALNGGAQVTFIDAGHILGSASLVIDVRVEGGMRRLVFSGDIGSPGHPVLRDPTPPPRADYAVMESTYGDHTHRSLADSVEELWQAIGQTLMRGGNAIIPSFALERSQELLYFIREGVERARLPAKLPVFLDSPMAISATEIMRHHPECFDSEARERLAVGDPLAPPGLRFTRAPAESMALARITGGAVIIAGSGMCTGGRVRHHLRNNLGREASSVIFVGFAAEGTLARAIIDGAKVVELRGESVQVKARIHTINGFSAHAGQPELLAWHAATGRPRTTFLVHGEPDRGMTALARLLARRGKLVMPVLDQAVTLT